MSNKMPLYDFQCHIFHLVGFMLEKKHSTAVHNVLVNCSDKSELLVFYLDTEIFNQVTFTIVVVFFGF